MMNGASAIESLRSMYREVRSSSNAANWWKQPGVIETLAANLAMVDPATSIKARAAIANLIPGFSRFHFERALLNAMETQAESQAA